ncbi:hypothetical protein ACENW9_000800 [Escherichia coli]
MKGLAKIAMVIGLVGLAFNANAFDIGEKAKMAAAQCAHKAEMYELRNGDGNGYMEMFFNVACEYKAVIPLFKDAGMDKVPEVKKYMDRAEKHFHELKKEMEAPEMEEGRQAMELGELMGFNIKNRVQHL